MSEFSGMPRLQFLVATILALFLVAGCQTTPEGLYFFQSGEGRLQVTGATEIDVPLTRVTGADHAIYRDGKEIGVALESSDAAIRLFAAAAGITGPGTYKESRPLELLINCRTLPSCPEGVTYSCFVQCGDCSLKVTSISKDEVRGTLSCLSVHRPDLGPESDSVDVQATFHLSKPRRGSLPTPRES